MTRFICNIQFNSGHTSVHLFVLCACVCVWTTFCIQCAWTICCNGIAICCHDYVVLHWIVEFSIIVLGNMTSFFYFCASFVAIGPINTVLGHGHYSNLSHRRLPPVFCLCTHDEVCLLALARLQGTSNSYLNMLINVLKFIDLYSSFGYRVHARGLLMFACLVVWH